MLKRIFKDKLEFEIYVAEQKIRAEKGYLTRSERETLKKMQEKNYKPIIEQEKKPKVPIVTNIHELRKSCAEVTKEDNVKEIVDKLKEALKDYSSGLGITANQIGINKKISYCKIPQVKDKKVEIMELVLINSKIVEKERNFIHKNEGCISFPGIWIDTDRYVFITVEYQNEKLEKKAMAFQDYEALVIQHEIDHTNGITIFDKKHKAK